MRGKGVGFQGFGGRSFEVALVTFCTENQLGSCGRLFFLVFFLLPCCTPTAECMLASTASAEAELS